MRRFSGKDCSRLAEYQGIFLTDRSKATGFAVLRNLKKWSNVLAGD